MVGAIIQARISSERLPGKVMMDLPYGTGITVVENIVSRIKGVKKIEKIILATTVRKEDDALERLSRKLGIKCFRGDRDNVLSRFIGACSKYGIGTALRLTADNPCIDPSVIKKVLDNHIRNTAEYTLTSGYPLGTNIEIVSFEALKKVEKMASDKFSLEHVTSYINEHPDRFKIIKLSAEKRLRMPQLRFTMDTMADYIFLCCLFGLSGKKNFGIKDSIDIVKKNKYLTMINKDIKQRS